MTDLFVSGPRRALVILLVAVVASGCGTSGEYVDPNPDPGIDVGYGEQGEEDITGAVETVDVDEAVRQNATTIAEILRGRISGVIVSPAPGGGLQIRIRGATSLIGNASPLYVLDGIPVQADRNGSLSMLNPYDIESISVLKNASATAIYGSRGAHGVIVIKTKLR